MRRTLLTISFLALLVAICQEADSQVTIHRDQYGVPSIVADRLEDAVFALGYCTAQDNAERMALNFKQARGRMGEVEGRGQLLADSFIRALGIEEAATKKARNLDGEIGSLITAFCDGANKAIAEQKGKIPDWIGPIDAVDVLAMTQLVNAAFPLQEIAGQLLPGAGSNQFAVGPKRSASGHAILSADPHLTWTGPLAWYEFALYTKDLKFRGVTLPGLPFGVMGHTDKVAWCMTNNNPDLYDFYVVKTNPDNPKQYSYHGEWRDFDNVSYEVRYKDADGQLKPLRQTARLTAWGPMIPLSNRAVRLSMIGSWDGLDEPLRMARARDAKELREALRPLGISMWNIVYADTQGNIGYQYNARVPRRDESINWNKPVEGSDPKTKWGELWTIDQLPHVENPKSGLLVNANSAPWLTPLGDEVKSEGWPAYVTSYGPTTRYERLSSILSLDTSISVDEAKTYATDTQVPYAISAIRVLVPVASKEAELTAALKVLTRWDKRSDVNSSGCGLYLYWLRADKAVPALARKADAGTPWTTEEGATAVTALKQAVEQMTKDHGRLDVPWGEMHVSKRGDRTVPVSGFGYVVPGDSTAAVAPNFGPFKDGKITCIGGSSFRMIVHLDPKGVRSWSILPYGNSHNPQSPHYADQMRLHGQGSYKETYFGVDAAKKAAVETVTVGR
jgi:acyl-homoserine-lactone acylase